ncbi:hypothetical protein GALL_535280 [mine drainage metagenome]|uniref:Uridine kinase n=1 Tax=mine drainage metagenome TaxID=410659 RepID=A0A1J5PAT5_9ZZZZ
MNFRPYDWVSHQDSGGERTFVPEGVVLVEGLYTMRQALMSFYDMTIWVVADDEERMARINARPPAETGWLQAWFRGERAYMASEKPQERAMMAVSGPIVQ